MDRSITAFGVMISVVLGLVAGSALAKARRAWSDYQKTKGTLPGLKSSAWSLTSATVRMFAVVGVLAVLSLVWAAIGR